MAIALFIFIIGAGAFAAFRLLAPEMYLSIDRTKLRFPWQRVNLAPDSTAAVPVEPREINDEQLLPPPVDFPILEDKPFIPDSERLVKLEVLLSEKNKTIEKLSTEIIAERSHRREFDQVKEVMIGEILRLKNQIKELKGGRLNA